MSVAITAQVPVEFAASSPATASPQAGQGTGATTEQGLVDFFAKARVDAGNGQTCARRPIPQLRAGRCSGNCASSSRRRISADAENQATRAKQRAAAVQAKTELATLDTLGSARPI